jgi:hypothetical protein
MKIYLTDIINMSTQCSRETGKLVAVVGAVAG